MKKPLHSYGGSENFYTSDNSGSIGEDDLYGVDDYVYFLSNGMSDNEKIDAYNYFQEYLDEQ